MRGKPQRRAEVSVLLTPHDVAQVVALYGGVQRIEASRRGHALSEHCLQLPVLRTL